MQHFNQSLTIFEKTEDSWNQANTHNNIGKTYIAMGVPNEAIKALSQAQRIAEEPKLKALLRTMHQLMCQAYMSKKDYKKALEHKTLEFEIHDELLNEKYADDLLKSQSVLNSEVQEVKFQLQSAELKKQRFLRYSSMVGFVLIGFICFLLYRIILVRKRTEISLVKNIKSLKQAEAAREMSPCL